MAAIARKRVLPPARIRALAAIVVATVLPTARADASADARAQVTAVAEALTSGDAAEAMRHFTKSFHDYETLRQYFQGLSAFQVENELDLVDEQDSEASIELTVSWDITLTDVGTDRSRRRSGEVHVKVTRVDSKWRIVEFSPFEIFNPQIH